MIKHSQLADADLELRLTDKFDQLKIKIAEDQGLNTAVLMQYTGAAAALSQQQRDLLM